MFNTLPSNSVTSGGSGGGGDSFTPAGFPAVTNAQRYNDVKTYFDDNTAAQLAKFGPRYAWATSPSVFEAPWLDVINLVGPGVMQFLAIWSDLANDNKGFDMRIVIDGSTALEITNAWTAAVQQDEGYILLGAVLWDDVANEPTDPPYGLENLPYASRFQLQIRCTSSAIATTFRALYRQYDAK